MSIFQLIVKLNGFTNYKNDLGSIYGNQLCSHTPCVPLGEFILCPFKTGLTYKLPTLKLNIKCRLWGLPHIELFLKNSTRDKKIL